MTDTFLFVTQKDTMSIIIADENEYYIDYIYAITESPISESPSAGDSICETPPPENQNQDDEIQCGHLCPNCEEVTYNPHDNQNHCSDYCARGNPPTTCWGCHQDQPNQLAHMDPGGCLYNIEDQSDSDH